MEDPGTNDIISVLRLLYTAYLTLTFQFLFHAVERHGVYELLENQVANCGYRGHTAVYERCGYFRFLVSEIAMCIFTVFAYQGFFVINNPLYCIGSIMISLLASSQPRCFISLPQTSQVRSPSGTVISFLSVLTPVKGAW